MPGTTSALAVPKVVPGEGTMPSVPETINGRRLCDMSETAMMQSEAVANAPVIEGSTPPILAFMRNRLGSESNESNNGGVCRRLDKQY
jgi:hypothetical protein